MPILYDPDLDIVSSGSDVIVNTVNCVGVMGAGVAKSVAQAWPSVLPSYVEACRSKRLRPGLLHVHRVPDGPIIVNMATKDHWRQPSSPDWVGSGLFFLSLLLQRQMDRHPGSIRSVTIPPPGCGHGGLSWSQVHPMMRACLSPLPDLGVRITVTADQPDPVQRPMIYTGIGSRKAPDPVLRIMRSIGAALSESGYLLRSGGALGSDSAFEEGAISAGGSTEIFLASPKKDTLGQGAQVRSGIHEVSPMFDRITQHLHPAPIALTAYGRRLMNRNGAQVFGSSFDIPIDIMVCWTPGGSGSGGTGQAIRIAKVVGIPVLDLGAPEFSGMSVDRLLEVIRDRAMIRRSEVMPMMSEVGARAPGSGRETQDNGVVAP